MTAPNPLPKTIPVGTKVQIAHSKYEFISIGKRQYYSNNISYVGDIKNEHSGQIFGQYGVYPNYIVWESIPIADENNLESSEILEKLCIWCGDTLGSNQNVPYCDYGKVYCKEYYFALKERMAVDFREPTEALDYDKESVRRYVNNLLGIK